MNPSDLSDRPLSLGIFRNSPDLLYFHLWVPFGGNKGKGVISLVRDCPKCKDKRSDINHFKKLREGIGSPAGSEVSCEQALCTTPGVGDF